MMFEQLWMSGILFAFSVFGIKAGIGIGARIYNTGVPLGKKIIFIGANGTAYLLLFVSMYLLVTRLNLLNYLDHLSNLIQYGMLVHLLVALGMFAWGAKLLLNQHRGATLLRASLLLVIPCPVCATVILLNLTLALSLSSLTPLMTTWVLFFLFGSIIALTLAVIFPYRRRMGSGTRFLGSAMTLISLYFLMTLILAPLYPEIKGAFAMAISNNPLSRIKPIPTLILSGISLALAGLGFARTYYTKGGIH